MNLWKVQFRYQWSQSRVPYDVVLPEKELTWFIVTKVASVNDVYKQVEAALSDMDRDNKLLKVDSATWLGQIENDVRKLVNEDKTIP